MSQLYKVTDDLLISNARSACSAQLLQQEGVTLCVNVSRQQPFPPTHISTFRVPVFDDPSENVYKYFDWCADAIAREAARGGKTVVYCKNGRSRSASICMAYLMKHHTLSLQEAFKMVKTVRPVVDPNPGFWNQLEKYEQDLQRRGSEEKWAPCEP